jgi:hypothetical protein
MADYFHLAYWKAGCLECLTVGTRAEYLACLTAEKRGICLAMLLDLLLDLLL